jgi:archaellum component FlaG (FlaF/FlaG flagellin family)
MERNDKKSQVWVETVVYTLIGLSIIGVVLGIVKPAIEEKRDSISIKQSVELLNHIDEKINEVKYTGTGNSRQIILKIGKGKLSIDSENDSITMLIDNSRSKFSEIGVITNLGGNLKALTLQKGKLYSVNLMMNYSQKMNITYNGKENAQIFQPAPVQYDVYVSNNRITNGLVNIDFK